MASLDSSMPPRTDCSAARSCGGVRPSSPVDGMLGNSATLTAAQPLPAPMDLLAAINPRTVDITSRRTPRRYGLGRKCPNRPVDNLWTNTPEGGDPGLRTVLLLWTSLWTTCSGRPRPGDPPAGGARLRRPRGRATVPAGGLRHRRAPGHPAAGRAGRGRRAAGDLGLGLRLPG